MLYLNLVKVISGPAYLDTSPPPVGVTSRKVPSSSPHVTGNSNHRCAADDQVTVPLYTARTLRSTSTVGNSRNLAISIAILAAATTTQNPIVDISNDIAKPSATISVL